jgi:L-lactate dehydrogenase complex protein LldG
MFSNILHNHNSPKNLEGKELDSDPTKKLYTTYVPQDVLENEIYNHAKTYVEIPHDADLNFAQKFIDKDGKFIYCTTKQELGEKLIQFVKLNELRTVFLWEESIIPILKESDIANEIKIERVIDHANIAISYCESLVSDEGNIVLNTNQNRFRPLENFPEFHIILASKSQVKLNIEHAVSDYMLKHHDVFPFLLDISPEEKTTRFAMNKPILNSRGTKKVFVFYCEECCFE